MERDTRPRGGRPEGSPRGPDRRPGGRPGTPPARRPDTRPGAFPAPRRGAGPAAGPFRGPRPHPATRPAARPEPPSQTAPLERRAPPPRGPAGNAGAEEAKLCGLNACLAVFAKRPDDIVRAYVTQAQLAAASALLSWCAKQHRAYHVVTSEEMSRITQSSHHEGICLLVKPPLRITLEQLCMRLAAQTGPVCVLLLEGVTNPHNLGAILRVAAHFGATAVVQCGAEDAAPPRLSAAVCRTAEGAAEQVPVIQVRDARDAIERLRRCALAVLATSSHASTSLYGRGMPRRCLLLLGSEAEGLSETLVASADAQVSIPGTGWVESLNVACATAVLLGEFRRVQPCPAPAPAVPSPDEVGATAVSPGSDADPGLAAGAATP
jgi:RNA methyltransferase, TrmH family